MVALISVLLTVPGIVGTTSIVQDASIEISQIEAEIYDTDISISSASASAGSSTVTLTLSNSGSEKLWNYEKFDVFLTYDGASSGRVTDKLTYSLKFH